MINTRENSAAEIFNLLQSAFTRQEIEKAHNLHRAHLQEWPEDRILDLAHGSHNAKLYMEEREQLASKLGLTLEDFDYRESVLRWMPEEREIFDGLVGIAPRNKSAEAFREARIAELRHWLRRYPNDSHVIGRLRHLEEEKERESKFLEEMKKYQ